MIVGNVRIISTLRITISFRYKTFQKKHCIKNQLFFQNQLNKGKNKNCKSHGDSKFNPKLFVFKF
jgi:hypothetical protein